MLASSRQHILLVSLTAGSLLLGACGGDRKEQRGRFIDSPVQGAEYFSDDKSGLTDVDGGFTYTGRSTVRFAIGAVDLGQARGDDIITPMDLADSDNLDNPLVLNRARLLLSLDSDQNPSNGITITAETRAAATQPISFDQALLDFELDAAVIDLVNVAQANFNTMTVVSAADAKAHLENTLEGLRDDEAPTANAGPDQTVLSGETVYLCGRVGDLDNAIVDFSWRQLDPLEPTLALARPEFETPEEDEIDVDLDEPQSPSTLCDADNLSQLSVTFTAPVVNVDTVFNLEFSVEDESGLNAFDTVQVTVTP